MLLQVIKEDQRIKQFPKTIIEQVGSVEEISHNVVVFSAFGGKDEGLWNMNFCLGEKLISGLQSNFPYHQGSERKITYVVNRVCGFRGDNELFK